MQNTTKHIAYRFFILDDSGSMSSTDGQTRMTLPSGKHKMVSCSRWSELQNAISFLAEYAYVSQSPSEFRFLNNGNPIVVGETEDDGQSLKQLRERMDAGPSGATPLCKQIRAVVQVIKRMAPELRARGQRVSVTIASDGVSSDGDVANALRELMGMPVWTVIRLCTDSDDVVDYWNNIDQNVELEMDVLDDLMGECNEVMSANPWLTYAEPLHRMREFGCHRKELDNLDEELLSTDMMRGFLGILLGGKKDDWPHPEVDPEGLLEKLHKAMRVEKSVWNPKTKSMGQWIDVRKLKAAYISKDKCSIQ